MTVRKLTARELGGWAALVAVAIAVRLYGFSGMEGSDDLGYAQRAFRLTTGLFAPQRYVFDTRPALWAPVSVLYRLFGVGETTTTFFPFAASVATAVVVAFLARELVGARNGWIAGLLYALTPIDVSVSTQLVPEGPLNLWIALGALLLVRNLGQGSPRATSHRTERLLAAGSAVCFFAGWLTKESCSYSVLAILVAASALGPTARRRAARSLALLAALVGVEALAYFAATGDPLFRLHATQRTYEISDWFLAPHPTLGAMLRRCFHDGARTLLDPSSFGALHWLSLAALVWACARRKSSPGTRAVALWFGGLLLLYLFGSTSMTEYRPLILAPRHLAPLDVPGAVLGGAAIELVASWVAARRAPGSPVVAAAVLLALGASCDVGEIPRARTKPEPAVARFLSARGGRVVTDSRTAMLLDYWDGFRDPTRYWAWPPGGSSSARSQTYLTASFPRAAPKAFRLEEGTGSSSQRIALAS